MVWNSETDWRSNSGIQLRSWYLLVTILRATFFPDLAGTRNIFRNAIVSRIVVASQVKITQRDSHFTRSGPPMVPALTLSVIGDASNQARNAERHVSRSPPQPEQSERSYLRVSTIRSSFDNREKRERERKYHKNLLFLSSYFYWKHKHVASL